MPVRNDFSPGEFCWIDLSAGDLQAAAKWYGDLFGWTLATMDTPGGGHPYGFLMKGDAAIGGIGELNAEMKAAGVPPVWNSYVSTEDCEATEARVRELGGTVTVPTMEVPGHGKLAFFLDPGGASFAAWQSTAGPDSDGILVNDPGSLSWNELMTRDVVGATKFYGAFAGWTFESMPMEGVDYTMIKLGDKDAGGMMPMEGADWEGVPPHWVVYFAVEDCDATAEKAASTGGAVLVPPMDIPVGRFSWLRDPEGAAFAVIQLSPESRP